MFAEIEDAGVRRYHEQLDLWTWAQLQRDREKRAEQARRYHHRHHAKRTAAKQRWRAKHPDKARAQWRRSTTTYRLTKRWAKYAAAIQRQWNGRRAQRQRLVSWLVTEERSAA